MVIKATTLIPKLCEYCDKPAQYFLVEVSFLGIRTAFVCRNHQLDWSGKRLKI